MDRPTFENVKRQLPIYEAELEKTTAMWPKVKTNGAVDRLCAREDRNLRALQDALYEDTKDRNSREDCHRVPYRTIKAWSEGSPTPV